MSNDTNDDPAAAARWNEPSPPEGPQSVRSPGGDVRIVARIDMVGLARELAREERHPELVEAVERAAAAGSIRDDLRTALESLEHIRRMQETDDAGSMRVTRADVLVTGALFVQAIILYARAVESTASRPKLLGPAKLPKEVRSTHVDALVLRSKCIAHFGRGDALTDGPLFREAVLFTLLLADGRPKKQVSVLSTRAQHKVAFTTRFEALLRARLAQVLDKLQPLFDAVDTALEIAGRSDPALCASLDRHQFDVDAFAGTAACADVLRAQLEAGDVTDIDYAVMVPRT